MARPRRYGASAAAERAQQVHARLKVGRGRGEWTDRRAAQSPRQDCRTRTPPGPTFADFTARTSSGTKAFLDRSERQVDQEGMLPELTRTAMAAHARKAYMLQLAERSAAARRRKAQSSTP